MEDICSIAAAVGAQADMAYANGFEVGSWRWIYLFHFDGRRRKKACGSCKQPVGLDLGEAAFGGIEGDVRKMAGAQPAKTTLFARGA